MKIFFINCTMLICMVQFFISCHAQKDCTNCGVVVRKARFFDSAYGNYAAIAQFRDMTMWYKDSMVIQEAHHIYQNRDEYNNTTWKVIVEKYKFVDLRTKEIYEYYTLYDTSKMIKKCSIQDTGCARETWVIWTETHGFMPDKEPINMTDTVIDGISYKRLKFGEFVNTPKGNAEFFMIAYLRCDLKGAVVMYDKPFSRKLGCPLIRYDNYYSPPIYPPDFGVCEYLPRKLNKEELKVFAAWEKNAKEYNRNN